MADLELTSAIDAVLDADTVPAMRVALGLGTAAVTDSTAYATAAQGVLADTALQSITDLQTALADKQPLDSDLTAIAALTTTSFGRALLTAASSAALVTSLGIPVDNANTTITLSDADSGVPQRYTAATAITITVPSTLSAGFNHLWIAAGAGQITWVEGAGATINSLSGHKKSAGQHAAGGLLRVASGVYNLSGALTT